MTNTTDRLLVALTNSPGPFLNDLVPKKDLQLVEQSQAWTSLRAGLMVTSDYFLLACVATLNAYPDLKNLIPWTQLSVAPDVLSTFTSKVHGGQFITVGDRRGQILPYADYMPMATHYTIRYESASRVKITTDLKREFFCDCAVFSHTTGSLLAVRWPERLPFAGPLRSYLPWVENSSIEIEYTPTVINYDAWVKYIETKMSLDVFLLDSGLIAAYQLAGTAVEKIAVLTTALALTNNNFKNV